MNDEKLPSAAEIEAVRAEDTGAFEPTRGYPVASLSGVPTRESFRQ